ncbi:MAG: hypothetical protein JXM72_04165 [Deltaproteobacteria bacterium]|nr:hypothetical protein [Deltaproteobacteria bacterium]
MYKRYLYTVIIIIFLGMFCNAAITIAIDPYKVFGIFDFNKKNFEPNTRYLKIEHLCGNHEHDAYILGSSRVATYDVNTARKLTGLNYYNLTASGASMEEVLAIAEWLVKTQYIRQVIVGLDFDAMFLAGSFDTNDLLRKEHYLVSGEHPLQFYLKFLTFQPNTLRRAYRLNLGKDITAYRFDLSTGQVMFPYYDELIAQDHYAYVQKMIAVPETKWGRVNKGNLDAFFKTVRLFRSLDIDVLYVINPCHYLMMQSYDIDEYSGWLRSIVGAEVYVWDFTGFNSVTKNSYNFYEILHSRKIVGDLVLERIFTGKCNPSGDDNFGMLISSENIEDHIVSLKASYISRHRILNSR